VRLLIGEFNCDAQCTDCFWETPLHHELQVCLSLVLIGKKSTFICAPKIWNFHYPEVA